MPTLEFTTAVEAPLTAVWAFHQDVMRSLPALSPPADAVEIETADLPPQKGSRIVITARGPLGRRIRWVAKIVETTPPDQALSNAGFVDEQESGPFKSFRHHHLFQAIGPMRTQLTDRVIYEVGFGPLGWIADRVLVRRKLRSMFEHRHNQTRRLLQGQP